MAFPPQFLEELRHRLSIAEIVGRRLRLQRRGREYMALCPFHNEKTPSFTVSEEKGFFHCFGCGAHGDVVGFVMRSEGLSFPEAVEKLAQEAGLPVPASAPEDRARAQRQATALAVLEAAAAWYEGQLRATAGRPARDYLRGRGLEEATIARFRLGYAPDSRNALKGALAGAGFAEALLVEAGLLIRPDGGGASYDRFRGRVMFPITDRRGRVIAFGGRILGDGGPTAEGRSVAKYLNSPETPLFQKGRTLYGLAQAMKPARETGEVIVAEGYMDVIALAQAEFGQAVAPLGTALTEEQMIELWRLAPEPVLCFDGDAAGERAAARAADRALPLLKPGQSLRFAVLPPGEDPDSLVRGQGGAPGLREALDRARPLAAILWQMETAGRAIDTPERRAGLRERLRMRLRRIADRTVYRDYRIEMERRLEAEFGYSRALRSQGRFPEWSSSAPRAGWGQPATPPPAVRGGGEGARRGLPDPNRRAPEIALATLVNHPGLLIRHAEDLAHMVFPAGPLDGIRRALIDVAALHPELDSEMVSHYLSQQGFSGVLDALLHRTRDERFTLPAASVEQASEGFLHILALMREREARRETDAAAQRLAEDMTDEALARFEAKQRASLEGESRRRDLDR